MRLLNAKYGKCVLILDNAKYHRSNMVNDYIKSTNKDMILLFLPPGAPHLNAIEECWHQVKTSLIGTYFETLEDLKEAIAKYLRAKTFNLDVFAYLYRVLAW